MENYFATNLYEVIIEKLTGTTIGNYKSAFSSYNYIDGLLSLYKESRGIDNIFESEKTLNEFIDWIYRYRNLTERYARFVKNHNIDLQDHNLAELDKSIIDSIVGRSAKIISRDAPTLLRPYTFIVQKDGKTYINNHNALIFPYKKNITKIMTQNPYYTNPKLDYLMMNEEGYDIYIGMYGYEDDNDKDTKIDYLEKLRSDLGYGRLYIEKEGNEYYSLFKAINSLNKKTLNKYSLNEYPFNNHKVKKINERRSHS